VSQSRSCALVCTFLVATLCACGGGGNGEDDFAAQQSASSTPSPRTQGVSAWTGVAAFGLTDGGVSFGESLAIDDEGRAHLLVEKVDPSAAESNVTWLAAFNKRSAGGWDLGQRPGPAVTFASQSPSPTSPMPSYDGSTVQADEAGNALATWTYCGFSGSNQQDFACHIYFSRRDASVGEWASPEILQRDAHAFALDAKLTVEPSGVAWAVWSERTFKVPFPYIAGWYADANDQYAVFAAKFDPAVGWAAAEKVSGDVKGTIRARVRTDSHENPRLIIAWTNPDTRESTLWVARRSADGTWAPLETLAVAPTDQELIHYDLAVDATDDAVATWHWRYLGQDAIRSRRFTAAGGWEPTVELSSSGSQPQLAMDNAGSAFVAWTESDGTSTGIWTARFEKSKSWMPPQRISSAAATLQDYSELPKIAFDGAGNAVAVWRKYLFSLKQMVVRANYYSNTDGWGTDETISAMGHAGAPELAVSKSGHAIAVWVEQIPNGAHALLQHWSASRAP
jgi:hypothetical protein